ncbi:MAG: FmdB family zinc ribbon protein [Gammaproteobacteria bacterium]
MPIYEYQCQACRHELEKLQKIADEPLRDCPGCGKPELRRKVSAAGFRLKGAGWYETDFKKNGKKNLAGDSGGGSESASTSTASTGGTSASTSPAPAAAPSSAA